MLLEKRIALRSLYIALLSIPLLLNVDQVSSHEPTMQAGLGDLAMLSDAETRMVSPENPTGEKGHGAMAAPNANLPFSKPAAELGQGWKVSPFIKVKAHETVTLMDVSGPGTIQHIWMTSHINWHGVGRASVLRFYWDGEDSPSIETPLTDFFAIGHEEFSPVTSLPVVVNPTSAVNCYWPMPFRKRAKITLTNDSDAEISLFTYQITYALGAIPADAGYFHAQWRRAVPDASKRQVYTILDGVKGRGRYVGTFLAWTSLVPGWFGEGEVKFYIDGDDAFPTLSGTGTEDYFGASYGFQEKYSTAYLGSTLLPDPKDSPQKYSLYRWHVQDPINFRKDLRVTVQALGWAPLAKLSDVGLGGQTIQDYLFNNGKYQTRADDIASVAYWYQQEPHAPFPRLPPWSERSPR